MKKLRHVKQEHDYGCGVACVAICVGSKYQETFPTFETVLPLTWETKQKYRTRIGQLINVLNDMKSGLEKKKIAFHEKWSSKWEEVEGRAIVGVDNGCGPNNWHWVVVERDGERFCIHDPEKQRCEDFSLKDLKKVYKHRRGKRKYLQFCDAAN